VIGKPFTAKGAKDAKEIGDEQAKPSDGEKPENPVKHE
jgi:hypothetical protein